MKRVAKRFRITQIKTTAYHPESNGALERSHHVLAEYLKQFVSKDAEWDSWLEMAAWSYNSSVHSGTLYTPYELVFGKLPRTPSSDPLQEEDRIPTYQDYMIDLVTRINRLQSLAHDNLINAKVKAKYYFDQKAQPRDFRIGDSAWLLKGGKIPKLEDQYTGPYVIVDTLRNGNIKIQLSPKRCKIVHANRLRLSYIDPGEI